MLFADSDQGFFIAHPLMASMSTGGSIGEIGEIIFLSCFDDAVFKIFSLKHRTAVLHANDLGGGEGFF